MYQRHAVSMCILLFLLPACGRDDAVPAADVTPASGSAPGAAVPGDPPDAGPANRAAQEITADYMQDIVVEISSDAYEGRGPGSPGDEKARKYLADEMAKLGLEPGAADGGWEQTFELVGVKTKQPETWTFEGHDKSLTIKQWDQFIVASGLQAERTGVDNAELVFVGYGIQAAEYDWDDFKGADLEGKLLVVMNNDPDWDADLFAGETRLWYGRWDYKYLSAAMQGAAGAIIIHTQPSAGYPFQVVQTSWSQVRYELPAGDEPNNQINAWVTEDTAKALVAMAGFELEELRERAYNRDFEPVPLGITTSIAMDVEITRVQSANVLGLIPGSDPEIEDEAVIYTAHHDHLGIGEPNEAGDAIYNGAMDNASGVAQVLAIARAVRRCRKPRGGRYSSPWSARKSRACSDRNGMPRIRPFRPARSRPISTSTVATSGAIRMT